MWVLHTPISVHTSNYYYSRIRRGLVMCHHCSWLQCDTGPWELFQWLMSRLPPGMPWPSTSLPKSLQKSPLLTLTPNPLSVPFLHIPLCSLALDVILSLKCIYLSLCVPVCRWVHTAMLSLWHATVFSNAFFQPYSLEIGSVTELEICPFG